MLKSLNNEIRLEFRSFSLSYNITTDPPSHTLQSFIAYNSMYCDAQIWALLIKIMLLPAVKVFF